VVPQSRAVFERIAQGRAEGGSADLKDVAILGLDAVGDRQRRGAEIVDVEITRTAEAIVLEVMIFEVGQRVAHVGLAGQEGLLPDRLTLSHDAAHALDRVRDLAHHHFGANGGVTQLGMREIQIVLPLGDVVGIFIAEGEAKAHRAALCIDHV